MRFAPDSVTGRRLRKHGIASAALARTRVLALSWPALRGFTIPLPLVCPVILIGKKYLDRQLDGELADNEALAPLARQYCYAHQRLQWGFFPYVWRHLVAKLFSRRVPVHRRQVEREAYQTMRRVHDYYVSQSGAAYGSSGQEESYAEPSGEY